MVHLRPVRRPYGLFTARRKAVRYIYGPLKGRIAYLTDRKQDLWLAWGTVWKAAQKAPREEFPMYFSFMFYDSIRAITETIHRWLYFLSTASV